MAVMILCYEEHHYRRYQHQKDSGRIRQTDEEQNSKVKAITLTTGILTYKETFLRIVCFYQRKFLALRRINSKVNRIGNNQHILKQPFCSQV